MTWHLPWAAAPSGSSALWCAGLNGAVGCTEKQRGGDDLKGFFGVGLQLLGRGLTASFCPAGPFVQSWGGSCRAPPDLSSSMPSAATE